MEELRLQGPAQLGDERYAEFNLKHGDLIKNTASLNWAVGILKGVQVQTDIQTPNEKPLTVLRIACPVDVTVSLGDKTLSSNPNNLTTTSDFGELYLLGENGEIKIFALDGNNDYDIKLSGTDEGTMDYSIRFFGETNNLNDEHIFEDIPITNQTEITTESNNDGETILSIDYNKDGQQDAAWVAEGPNTIGKEEVITGLANDNMPTKSKTWTWSADEPATYRYALDTNPNGAPSGTYSAIAIATQSSGTGTYYIHVQAIDDLGNESAVATVSALRDNLSPILLRPDNDLNPDTLRPVFTWQSVKGATSYKIQISKYANFSSTTVSTTVYLKRLLVFKGYSHVICSNC
jgi:hypothetical protein